MTEKQVRILVMDDEEAVRNLLKRILEEVGYDVITAANGEEALYTLYQKEVEMALLDIRMPGISGIEVLGKLTSDWPDICVIMVTAVLDAQTAVQAMKMGALDYITKPFNRDDVVQKVHKALEKWNLNLKEKRQYLELKKSFTEQTKRMQEQFAELVNSLAREHRLLQELAVKQVKGSKSLLSDLPPELQKPIATVEEFKDALLKILRRG